MVSRILVGGLTFGFLSVVWAESLVGPTVKDWLGLFPEQPCQDGWSGCVVGGFAVDAGAGHDSRGLPQPTDLRLGWFDLQPTPVYSPFAELSSFTGELAAAAPVVIPSEEAEEQEEALGGAVADADPVAPDFGMGSTGTGSSGRGGSDSPSYASGPSAVREASPSNSSSGSGRASSKSTESANWGDRGSSGAPLNWGERDDGVVDASSRNPTRPEADNVVVVEEAPPEPVVTCDDVTAMEPAALMGRLREGQVDCIEDRMFTASQVDKDKLSRLLLVNSEANKDTREWERLVRRHLEEIDRSDPNLCFKYAVHLSKGGVSRSYGVIKWTQYALENKSRWSGSTFKKRVTDLYRLRAQAASRIWEQANRDLINAASNREDLKSKESKARGQAKTFAKEWLDYVRASGQDSRAAMAMCESAAGSRDFCE